MRTLLFKLGEKLILNTALHLKLIAYSYIINLQMIVSIRSFYSSHLVALRQTRNIYRSLNGSVENHSKVYRNFWLKSITKIIHPTFFTSTTDRTLNFRADMRQLQCVLQNRGIH